MSKKLYLLLLRRVASCTAVVTLSNLICSSTIALTACITSKGLPLPKCLSNIPTCSHLFRNFLTPCRVATNPSFESTFTIAVGDSPNEWKTSACHFRYMHMYMYIVLHARHFRLSDLTILLYEPGNDKEWND